MCGITGIYAFTASGRETFSCIGAASGELRHRGPDADKTFVSGKVAMAARRLAIIAPQEGANQPLTDAAGRYTILYNGEIFNYKQLRTRLQNQGVHFESESDTEVVLHLYRQEGQECLKKLRGFFVFAVYDAAEESLFLARDRFGEKPLLYFQDADRFIFGSELRALFALSVPRALDYTSLYQYLQLTYVAAPASMVQGVKKLLPGHSLYIKGHKVQEHTWYRLPFDAEQVKSNPRSYKQQQEKLSQLLQQAVEERSTADVPVGAFLSGGIDSSVVVGLAAQVNPRLQTFSVGYKEDKFFDETHYSRLVASKFKTDHTEILLSREDLGNAVPDMLGSLSEPFADASALAFYALSKRAGAKVKAVLSGDGADELFAGYNKHRAEYRALRGGLAAGAVGLLGYLWEALPKSRNSFLGNKIRQLHHFAAGAKLAANERYWLWATWQQELQALQMLSDKSKDLVHNRLYRARKNRLTSCIPGKAHNLNHILCADWHLVLANDMLPKIDLMGMANGVEVRSPFLDHRVVKFAFSLPASSKIDATYQKKILQDTYRSMLPPELYRRPKMGFEIPLLPFMKQEMQEMIRFYLSEEYLRGQGIFDVAQVKKLVKLLHTPAGGSVQTQVWVLLVFQHWWERWMQSSHFKAVK